MPNIGGIEITSVADIDRLRRTLDDVYVERIGRGVTHDDYVAIVRRLDQLQEDLYLEKAIYEGHKCLECGEQCDCGELEGGKCMSCEKCVGVK